MKEEMILYLVMTYNKQKNPKKNFGLFYYWVRTSELLFS